MSMVNTILGDVPEEDVQYAMEEQNLSDQIVVNRQWVYIGTQYPDKVGQVVRRDCWVTLKTNTLGIQQATIGG